MGTEERGPSDTGAAWAAVAGGTKRGVGRDGGVVGLGGAERGQVVGVGRMRG